MTPQRLCREYVCAVCWGVLVERYIEGRGGWVVICSADVGHEGYCTRGSAARRKAQSVIDLAETVAAYRSTEYAEALGLTRPAESPEAILARNRRALGRDDTGLF